MSGDSHKNYALAHRAFFITKRLVKLLTWIQAPLKYFDNYFYASTGYRNMADMEINQRDLI